MKTILKIILCILIVAIVAVVGVGVYVGISISDKTDNTPDSVKNNNYPTEKIISREVAKSMDNDNENVVVSLDKDAMTELLYSIVMKINFPFLKVKGAYLYFDDNNNIMVEVPISSYGVSSCIKGNLSIKENEDSFTFQINQGKLGKFEITSGFVSSFVLTDSQEKSVENELKKQGINADVDFKTYSLTMTKEDLLNYISTTCKDDKNSALYSLLADLCLSYPNVFKLNLGENQSLGFTIYTSNIKYDETRDGTFAYSLDYDSIKDLIYPELDKTIDYKNINPVFNYYVEGYEDLENDEDKAAIDALGYSQTYEGIKPSSESTMSSIILNQQPSLVSLAEILLSRHFEITIDENNFNTLFEQMAFVGKSIAFCSNNKVGYFSIEGLFINIEDNAFTLTLLMNINNRRICVNTYFESEKSNSLVINAELTKLKLGGLDIDEKYISPLLTYLSGVLTEDWIIINPDEHLFTINLEEIINSGTIFKELIKHENSKELSFVSSTDNDGKLKISYSF